MRVLFVVSDRPLSSTAPGGSGTVFGGLLALLRARGDEVHVVLLRDSSKPSLYEAWKMTDSEGSKDLASWVKSIQFVEYQSPAASGFLARKVLGIWDPQRRTYPFLRSDVSRKLTESLNGLSPDVVIAPDLTAGLIASHSGRRAPLVYYHQDFFWRIKELREGGSKRCLRNAWGLWLGRRAENQLVRDVDACITGSLDELDALRRAGAANPMLLPLVVTASPRRISEPPLEPCRIVHLGGFGTTATRLGLERFLDVVWPRLLKSLPEVKLWVVGDTSAAEPVFLDRLESIGAHVTGFVEDLSRVLRPGDLHVVPWELSTGVRTRVASCFQYGQVLVAVRAGVAGFGGLESGKHCILVERLEDLADSIVELTHAPERRMNLALGGQEYLRERLSIDAVRPQFDVVLRSVTGGRPGVAA